MFDYLIKQFQKILNNKDIREYKKNFFYYILFRLVRKKLQKNLKVKIYNFYIWASFQKNKQSHSILRKCDFEDQQELKLIENIYNNKKIFFLIVVQILVFIPFSHQLYLLIIKYSLLKHHQLLLTI